MVPMHGVPSALVARNVSWVRQQAQALVRHLPANVEKADLIQAGLIAVAQAAISFEWPEADRDSEAGREAFVRYARARVRGAMIDELRQMDVLSRSQRRKVKVVQIARERWRAAQGREPSLGELAAVCSMTVDEVAALDTLAEAGRAAAGSGEGPEGDEELALAPDRLHPATERDEVEARVDTAIVLRHLEGFFAGLPERERRVIDAYLGVGLSPVELADELKLTPARVGQIWQSLLRRAATRLGVHHRATDRAAQRATMDALVAEREQALGACAAEGPWGRMVEDVLMSPAERFGIRIDVPEGTRW